jgi:hypothetical protein
MLQLQHRAVHTSLRSRRTAGGSSPRNIWNALEYLGQEAWRGRMEAFRHAGRQLRAFQAG